ncbi:MAG: NAD-dependent epimerase/dehydratase family protein [Rhodospirillales bacterium]|nr:NAD-dependent epimerase/dehydratase family protein [Rhodospirillales bacterium]MBT3907621.1 NAD-dependent epimerase/dehydratase family protein [Rhodospirillaceae bacterium]MBT5033088.1 NAD-dependent epimerase/dehydratase family protein [Rhodospirillaceae bacterium]MBT6219896.1 NAD-dependent epimerase/dehydratase family protein [Rhodospirillaceae bacterium]MBT6362402.1 NAD-dependent epimerase/dehydratase family protein [Rhodospirillaceae bacterium]
MPLADLPAYTPRMQDQETPNPFCLAVTGGGGYIGRRLCRQALAQGIELTVLGRKRPEGIEEGAYQFVSYDLSGAAPDLTDMDAVVHLASAGLSDGEGGEVDVTGTRALAEAAHKAGVSRFVFVSSQSSRPDAPTSYGRGKFAVETMLAEFDALIVRPGLVCGGEEGGVYGKLCEMVRTAPIVPVTCASTLLQPVHVDQLCEALLRLADPSVQPKQKMFYLGDPTPISFGRLIKDLAWTRFGRRIRLVPLPISFVLMGIAIARVIPGLPNIPRERVLGLTDIAIMDSPASFEALGMAPCDAISAFAQENPKNRRRLLREGRALLTYVTGRSVRESLIRRYVRAVEATRGSIPLNLPGIVYGWPGLMRIFEPIGGAGRVADRLAIAMVIAETTPEGAKDFCALDQRSWLISIFELGVLLAVEAVFLPLRILLGRRNP